MSYYIFDLFLQNVHACFMNFHSIWMNFLVSSIQWKQCTVVKLLKGQKSIMKVLLSYWLLITWHVKTHFARFGVSDANSKLQSFNLQDHKWDLRAMVNNGSNLVSSSHKTIRRQIINSKPIWWYFYGVFFSFSEPDSVFPPLLLLYGKELGHSAKKSPFFLLSKLEGE